MVLDYNELSNEVIGLLKKPKTVILATSANDRVTAQIMNMVNDGLTIYFQTAKKLENSYF